MGWKFARPRLRRTDTQARPDPELLVSVMLMVATLILITNVVAFFGNVGFSRALAPPVALIVVTLNVALIVWGLRRLADLQYERERREDAEQRAAHLATTDTVTGLANRKGLADAGQILRARLEAEGQQLALISIQLHRFKAINDGHGFETGDDMLRAVAAALRRITPSDALVARLNGDEFAIALPVADAHDGVVEKIATTILRRVTAPFEIDGKMLQVGAYAGIAGGPAADLPLPDLLRCADIALERARSQRSARPVWFDEGMQQALFAYVEIEQGIRYALEHHQFVPFFEPQVDLATGAITGFEVLARWNHPLSGIIMPETFISVAEEHGLIARLSEQVVASALQQAVHWPGTFNLTVNISPRQLSDPWLAQRIVRLLNEYCFPADRFLVEITESSLFEDLELARSIAASLKAQGIRLALDDFGTGYSSLAHLRSLPFDMIKVDRTFTAAVVADRETAAIVRAIADLAKAIGVPVMAEGIEDAATHAAVLGLGCGQGQGWYFGKAMNANQAVQLLGRPFDSFAAPAQRRAS